MLPTMTLKKKGDKVDNEGMVAAAALPPEG